MPREMSPRDRGVTSELSLLQVASQGKAEHKGSAVSGSTSGMFTSERERKEFPQKLFFQGNSVSHPLKITKRLILRNQCPGV